MTLCSPPSPPPQNSVPYRWRALAVWAWMVFALIGLTGSASGAGTATICAKCQMQISQQLTLERQAFNATMTITNGLSTELSQISATIIFTDANGGTITSPATLFYSQVVDAPTVAPGGQTVALNWLIIPSPGAGGTLPTGTGYNVGATLTYKSAGVLQTVTVSPAYITVQPQPLLTLDYFLPEQVYGTDPTAPTIPVTPPVPFNLGVRVSNTGAGVANNLQINSGQPRITENLNGLAVKFLILGSSVNDVSAQPSLLANFGQVAPQQSSVARWIMTSSLSGTFSFTATYTHASSLGGAVTSLFKMDPRPHSLVQDILVDLPGRDAVRDFLANDGTPANPTYVVYESQGVADGTQVSNLSSAANLAQTSSLTCQFTMPGNPGFAVAKVHDVFEGQQAIKGVIRADGKVMNASNTWLSHTFISNSWHYFFNLFDDNNTSGLPYTVVFGQASALPPVFGPLGDQILTISQPFSMQVRATDPDGTYPIISAGSLPQGASLGASALGQATLTWTPTAAQVGNYPITFKATEGNVFVTKTITLSVSAGTKFAGWKQKYFPGVTDPSIIGDAANPAKDGFSNLLKYALGFDPTEQQANSGVLIGVIQDNGHEYLTLTYVARTDDPQLQLSVVGSNSPSAAENSWTPQTQSLEISQDGLPFNMRRVEIRDSQPIESGAAQRFLKLRVTNNLN